MNRKRDDMMNFDEIPHQLHRTYKQNMRFLLKMLVAYSFGASVSVSTIYLLKIKQDYVLRLWAATTISTGHFLYRAIITAERSKINFGVLKSCYILMMSGTAFIHLDMHTTFWFTVINNLPMVFMVYLMIYSQVMLYDANLGNINFLNCVFTVLFHLPAIVIYSARLYLQGKEIELHEHN
uniref:Transmembrane protein n=1 Tax=Solanum tuberosum TaxID=4113 RepID=M1DQ28_SOLTU